MNISKNWNKKDKLFNLISSLRTLISIKNQVYTKN